MTDIFLVAVDMTMRLEGLLSNDKNDPGRITKHGISLRFAGSIGFDIDGDGKTTEADIVAITPEHARKLYRLHFWDAMNCDDLPPAIALMAFDQAVNQGPKAAAVDLQRSLNVAADGLIGERTRRAAHVEYGFELLTEYHARRVLRYSRTPGWERYGLGWTRRASTVLGIGLNIYR